MLLLSNFKKGIAIEYSSANGGEATADLEASFRHHSIALSEVQEHSWICVLLEMSRLWSGNDVRRAFSSHNFVAALCRSCLRD